MTKILSANALATLLGLVLLGVLVLAGLGLDVPAVLEYAVTTLLGGAVMQQVPAGARPLPVVTRAEARYTYPETGQ